MSTLTITNPFSPNTVALSALVNQNFTEIVAWSTTIDHSNTTGSTGFWASDIKPLTAAQATFGPTATAVGYRFLANDVTAIPLTVSSVSAASANTLVVNMGATQSVAGLLVNGAAGITGDLQQWMTSSGGTLTLSVDKGGILSFRPGGAGIATSVFINNDNGATNGMLLNIPTGSTNGYRFGVAGSAVAQITNGGAIIAAPATAPAVSAGDIAASRSTTTGLVKFGGSSTSGIIDWNILTLGQISLSTGAGAFAAFSAGAYTNASDISLKTNVAAVVDSLSLISQLKPSSFVWLADSTNDIGFVAQDIAAIMPDAITTFADGTLGYKPVAILAHLVAAFQDYVSSHP